MPEMDNQLNRIRTQINDLRARLLAVGDVVRQHIRRDGDCTQAWLELVS
jgi:hypothetical protein